MVWQGFFSLCACYKRVQLGFNRRFRARLRVLADSGLPLSSFPVCDPLWRSFNSTGTGWFGSFGRILRKKKGGGFYAITTLVTVSVIQGIKVYLNNQTLSFEGEKFGLKRGIRLILNVLRSSCGGGEIRVWKRIVRSLVLSFLSGDDGGGGSR